MRKTRFSNILRLFARSGEAVLLVWVVTIPIALIGRDTLGEAVIALVYLVPVVWSAYRWGQLPGISAALTAALLFDFLFIPPFYTFAVARLEGWMVLAIFLGVATVVVERIQAGLTQAHEAVFMYELSSALCALRTPEAVAQAAARNFQQLFQARLVNVLVHPENRMLSIVASEPVGGTGEGRPDRVLPLINNWGVVGEIQIWRGPFGIIPAEDSRLLQDFASQTARAIERTQLYEAERQVKGLIPKKSER